MKAYQVLKRFQRKYHLTDREFEIVILLVRGFSSLKDLAHHLDLSTSTINNHLDNIYRKTSTGSKGKVLSSIILDLAEDLSRLEWQLGADPVQSMSSSPPKGTERVWLIAPDADERGLFSKWILDIGYQVIPIETVEAVEARLAEINIVPTVTMIDSSFGNTKVLSVVRLLRTKFGDRHPVVIINSENKSGELLADSIRAAGIVPKPCDIDQLRDALSVAMGQGQKRLESRVPMELTLKIHLLESKRDLNGRTRNLSINGFAVQCNEPVKPGELVSFDLSLARAKNIRGQGAVVWTREFSFKYITGIRITTMKQEERDMYENFIKARDLAKTAAEG